MTSPRTIALVSPLAWPPTGEVTRRIDAEARALAARGHRVSILAPAQGRDLLSQGRRMLAAVRGGDAEAALAAPGEVRIVPLGRAALPTGSHRRIGGPLDISTALEDVLSRVPFDVVHVHEPFSPTPVLSALRNARGITAATMQRLEPVAGVAFLLPMAERAVDRVDVWIAATESVRRAVTEHVGRSAIVVPPGVDATRFSANAPIASPAPLVIVARSTDREGMRFGLSVLRAAEVSHLGPVTLLVPPYGPRRTAVAIPKALRDTVRVVTDTGADAHDEVFVRGGIALFTTEEDLAGSAAVEAMARGMAVIAPQSLDADALITDGADGLLLPPFSREAWAEALRDLAGSTERRQALGDAASRRVRAQTWDDVAQTLEHAYDEAQRRPRSGDDARERIVADLRVHPSRALPPRDLIAACVSRGVDAVGVICETPDLSLATETARLAPNDLRVIVGQQIRTTEGDIVGLFLSSAVDDGLTVDDAVAAIADQGGVVMIPHPAWGVGPAPATIRALGDRVACVEALSGPASIMRSTINIEDVRLMQAFGLRVAAGSGATAANQIGASHLRMPPFSDARAFVESLADADPVQQRRGIRPLSMRDRRRGAHDTT